MEKTKKVGDSAFGGESPKEAVKSDGKPLRPRPVGNRSRSTRNGCV